MRRGWTERGSGEPPRPLPRLASAAEECDLLSHGEVLSTDLIPWGSNYTFLATLSHGSEPQCYAVYKPRRGEAPLWDFPDGTLYRRERAAYVAAQALAWDFIPLTVIRDGPHGIGSMQLYVETDDQARRTQWTESQRCELARIALFDLISNNADRKSGHCLLGTDGRVWGIDHGLTFHSDPKLRTVLWELYNDPIAPALVDDLRRLLETPPVRAELTAELRELLDRREVEAFFDRAQVVVEAGEYPTMSPYRRRPWPFF
jgi:hypothetical protein